MLKPLKLKLSSTYEYVELNNEGLGELYDLKLLDNPASLTKESFIENMNRNLRRPVVLSLGMAVLPNQFLVLQKNNDTGVYDGIVSFDTKEEMLELFEEI